MVAHKDLSGADLHEPKGIEAASANTVYVSNGSGSGTWKKLDIGALNTNSVKNANLYKVHITVKDITNPSTVLIPITQSCSLVHVSGVLNGAITTAPSVLTLSNNGSATIGTFTIVVSGSGEGVTYELTTSVNNTLTAGTFLKIACDGAASGGPTDLTLTLDFILT